MIETNKKHKGAQENQRGQWCSQGAAGGGAEVV